MDIETYLSGFDKAEKINKGMAGDDKYRCRRGVFCEGYMKPALKRVLKRTGTDMLPYTRKYEEENRIICFRKDI